MSEMALLGVNGIWSFLLGTSLFVVTLFLILLILVQRGKGGGLAGALGGMGGESALGTKAGDLFTRITVVTALIWILLCMLTYKVFEPPKPIESADDKKPAIGATEDGEGTEEDGVDTGDSTPAIDPLGAFDPLDLGGGADKGGDGEDTDSGEDTAGDGSSTVPPAGEGDSSDSSGTTGDETTGDETTGGGDSGTGSDSGTDDQ